MIFSTVTFLFYFFPLFLLLYFITPFKNTVLLVSSLVFYAWGEAGYTLILLVSIIINYVFGLLINKNQSNNKSKYYLSSGVIINLLLITYYKYFNFLASDIFNLKLPKEVHLPLGISFFTFQAISYLVDVHRKEAKVENNIINLALYISMFPQLIAGPIVRFKTVAKQIKKRVVSLTGFSKGLRIFIIGLGQKVLIANTVALTADNIFSLPEQSLTMLVAWLGALSYSLQIFFDFAGYSNMAIGLGLIMGFTFPKNFNYPYISQSITEFWRRWHISLSTWFRDYLYIPLGGNRVSPMRNYFNLILVFFLCGLWHGAAWTFIIWGTYHGLFLIIEKIKIGLILKNNWRPIRHIYTLVVVLIGWVIFRVDNFVHLNFYLTALLGLSNAETQTETLSAYMSNSLITVICLGTIFSLPISKTIKSKINAKVFIFSSELFYLAVFLFSIINIASGSYNPFIYFRF